MTLGDQFAHEDLAVPFEVRSSFGWKSVVDPQQQPTATRCTGFAAVLTMDVEVRRQNFGIEHVAREPCLGDGDDFGGEGGQHVLEQCQLVLVPVDAFDAPRVHVDALNDL